MNKIEFKAYRAREISFVNHIEGNNVRLEFENKYSYNVKYSKESTCMGELTVEITDKNMPDKFNIKVVVCGFFAYLEGLRKEVIHVETYNQLFPYIRALIQTLTVNAGIPPIVLPAIDISSQSIYKFDKNQNFNPEDIK